jgi:hypothetical protein
MKWPLNRVSQTAKQSKGIKEKETTIRGKRQSINRVKVVQRSIPATQPGRAPDASLDISAPSPHRSRHVHALGQV